MFKRTIKDKLQHTIDRGKSILLLGPRQTGKTFLIDHLFKPDIKFNFILEQSRLKYEKDISLFNREIEAFVQKKKKRLLVFVDEVQKIPKILNNAQDLIDQDIAQFIFTGSSARKLRRQFETNLLPGRVVMCRLDPIMLREFNEFKPSLNDLLLYGMLPAILNTKSEEDKFYDLQSYVSTYLAEEVRQEALVQKIGPFSRFLELAAIESGKLLNKAQLSQDIGVSQNTIDAYFQILEDCLIVERIEPFAPIESRRRLAKQAKYLFFDLGIRRACTQEGTQLSSTMMGHLFEQFVGLELIKECRLKPQNFKLSYWRDHNGPEVDYVLRVNNQLLAIEVKYTDSPREQDFRHLKIFLKEYPQTKAGIIICQTHHPQKYSDKLWALNWKNMGEIFRL